jgi:hypothetical protein
VVPVLALGGSDCEVLHDGLWGQPVNGVSSLAYVAAAACVLRRGGPPGPAVALGLVGVGSVLYHGPMPPGAEVAHDGSIAVLVAACCVAAWRRRSFGRPPVLALAALAAGGAVNVLTRTGAPLCRPHSLLQGHAAWHVLTAVAVAGWLASWRSAEAPDEEEGSGATPAGRDDQPAEPATGSPAPS